MFNIFKRLFGTKTSSNVKQLIGNGAVVIDVRTPYEFKSGHLPGSKNIPLNILPSKIEELKQLNKTIITVCRSGARSSTAKHMLMEAGVDACDGGPWTSIKSLLG